MIQLRRYVSALALLAAACGGASNTITVAGTVEIREVRLAPLASGRLMRLIKDEGDSVRSGDTVAILEQPGLNALIEQRQALAAAAEEARARLVWICDPNNPTGALVEPGEWETFLGDVSLIADLLGDRRGQPPGFASDHLGAAAFVHEVRGDSGDSDRILNVIRWLESEEERPSAGLAVWKALFLARRGAFDEARAALDLPLAALLAPAGGPDLGRARQRRRATLTRPPPRARRRLAGGRVLVVDDLATTGGTLAGAAATLRAAGARRVEAAVLGAAPTALGPPGARDPPAPGRRGPGRPAAGPSWSIGLAEPSRGAVLTGILPAHRGRIVWL